MKKRGMIMSSFCLLDLIVSFVDLVHGALKMGELVEFVNLGGNVFLAGSEKNSDAMRDFAYEFSVDYATTEAVDHFSYQNDSRILRTTKNIGPESVAKVSNPVLFRGVGHSLSGKNHLAFPILVGENSAFSGEKKVTEASLVGSKLNLVSAFQALNNARVVFAGSTLMFSNEFFNQMVQVGGEK
jgi:oligosaccharyltransferase complex subunit beta